MKRLWPVALIPVLAALGFWGSHEFKKRTAPVQAQGRPPVPPESPPPASAATKTRSGGVEQAPENKRLVVSPWHTGCSSTTDVVMESVLSLVKSRNPDGSWGDGVTALDGRPIDRTGVTALALLALIGAGYSHLSKEQVDGAYMGDFVQGGLKWTMARQGADGTLLTGGDLVLNQALAALALGETYGLTGSNLFKKQAQAALDAIGRVQLEDGSWGDPGVSAWATAAVVSGLRAGLEVDPARLGRVTGWNRASLETTGDPRAVFGYRLLSKDKTHPGYVDLATRLQLAADRGATQDLSAWYFSSIALYQTAGPASAGWKEWGPRLRERALKADGKKSSASESVADLSLRMLCLETYYRYSDSFGTHDEPGK